jgi:adenylate cyclase
VPQRRFSNLRVRATFESPTTAGWKARRTRNLERLRYRALHGKIRCTSSIAVTSGALTRRTWLATLFGAVLAAGLGFLLIEWPIGRGLIRLSYDFLIVARGEVAAPEVVVVYLDEVSHTALKQPLNAPWDRTLHARLIDRLSRAGARAIVFDVVFSDPSVHGPGSDQELARAMKESGRVVLGIDVERTGRNQKQAKPPIDLLLTQVASAGSVEVIPDSDMVVRRLHTWDDDFGIPSLSGATAEFLGVKAMKEGKAPHSGRAWLNYYGPPHLLESVSYYQALDRTQVPDAFFRDKIVFVGARLLTKFAGERKDEYVHPFSHWMMARRGDESALFIAGVEIQATAFLNLLRGDWLTRWPFARERAMILVFGLLVGFGLVLLRPVMATVVGLGAIGAVSALSYLLFRERLIWFPWLVLVVQILAAIAWSILFNSVQFYVRQRLYEQTLRIYLPPKLVRKFSRSSELLKPGAEPHTLTIFFSDIADFTNISQRMTSHDLAKLMNTYFQTAVAECIHKTDGTVVKYIGDAIFAFWNAPEAQADHAMRACEAALRLRECGVGTFDGHRLRTRIGIHTGEAHVGNFGSLDRVDYTALGESVNLASRLEGLNKYLNTECVISRTTKDGIGDRLVTRLLGEFQLKGFDKAVEVFELVDLPAQAEASRAWREAFAEALKNYREKNLEFAAIGFRQVLELRPDDGPSTFYLERIEDLALQPLPEDWTGFTQLKDK